MRPGGGKAKGAAQERLICQELSLWISHGKERDCFWRSAMSGGRATLMHRKGQSAKRQAGDISAVSPLGHKLTDVFYIESKFYRDLQIDRFLISEGTLHKFWRVAVREAERHSKWPMLIAKQNQFPTLVLTRGDSLNEVATTVRPNEGNVRVLTRHGVCTMMRFDWLLKHWTFKP